MKSLRDKGIHVVVWQEADLFVSRALEVEVASQGKTRQEALDNLKEALELYFEDEGVKMTDSFLGAELYSLNLPRVCA